MKPEIERLTFGMNHMQTQMPVKHINEIKWKYILKKEIMSKIMIFHKWTLSTQISNVTLENSSLWTDQEQSLR